MQIFFQLLRRFLIPSVFVVVLALLAGVFYLGRISAPQKEYIQTSINEDRAQEILQEVEKLIVLPQGEVPQMVMIDDAELIKRDQPFLTNAQNGEILIVYAQAQMAILYRPTANKLIAVGPVTNENSISQQTPSETPLLNETDDATDSVATSSFTPASNVEINEEVYATSTQE